MSGLVALGAGIAALTGIGGGIGACILDIFHMQLRMDIFILVQ